MSDDSHDLVQRVSALTQTVSEILVWVEQTERTGSIPAGTFDRARLMLLRQSLQREVATSREVLSSLEGHDVPMIRKRLTGIIQTLEARESAVSKELGGDEEVCSSE